MFKMDSEAFRRDLTKAIATLPQRVQQALKHAAQYAALMARTSRLYKSHTYGLQRSIRADLDYSTYRPSESATAATVTAGARYAGYVENGTMAHFIFPKDAYRGVLRFQQNGVTRFAKWVFHPGTKSRPFMQEAATKATPLFERLCAEAADQMFAA